MKFYRYVDILEYEGHARIIERVFYLVRKTPKGYWISADRNYKEGSIGFKWHRKRWVSKTTRKRYAYPTKEQAMEGFVARKRRQVTILTAQLERAKVAWAEGSNRLSPINQGAKHLTKDAYDAWKKTPMQKRGWTTPLP